MARKITRLVRDDSGGQWSVELVDKRSGLPIDLSNATGAVMYLRKKGTTTVLATINMVIESPATSGVLSLVWPLLNYEPGHYEGEIAIALTGGGTQTVYDLQRFYIRDDVGP